MVALSIDDLKSFTKKLFLGTDFDDFLLTEAKIVTFNSFTIDGHIRRGFYTEEEAGELKLQECSFWKTIRPICFSLIKGKRLPGSFHISLQANHQQTEDFLTSRQIPAVSGEQIKGLYLHIRYDDGKLFCITGSSLAIFTMDKTLDREWDAWVEEFLKKPKLRLFWNKLQNKYTKPATTIRLTASVMRKPPAQIRKIPLKILTGWIFL